VIFGGKFPLFSAPNIEPSLKFNQPTVYRTLAVARVACCWTYISIQCSG